MESRFLLYRRTIHAQAIRLCKYLLLIRNCDSTVCSWTNALIEVSRTFDVPSKTIPQCLLCLKLYWFTKKGNCRKKETFIKSVTLVIKIWLSNRKQSYTLFISVEMVLIIFVYALIGFKFCLWLPASTMNTGE